MSEKEKKVDFVIVVSGAAITLSVNLNQPLKSLIEKALKEAGEVGDPSQWGFFVEKGGEMVDLNDGLKVEEVLKGEQTVYLNKKAGAAG
jgi:hypothetical protein